MNIANIVLAIGFLTSVDSIASVDTTESVQRLIQDCGNKQHEAILNKIIAHESAYKQYAIHINTNKYGFSLKRQPKDLYEAMSVVGFLDRKLVSYDVGIGQINSENLNKFGLIGDQRQKAFDICSNIKMADQIYSDCLNKGGSVTNALSCYNTGNFHSGFSNGYVAQVLNEAAQEKSQAMPELIIQKPKSVREEVKHIDKSDASDNGDSKQNGDKDAFGAGDSDVFACEKNKPCDQD